MTKTTENNGITYTWEYDDNKRLVSWKDSTGRCVEFVYDKQGRPIASWSNDGTSETIEYNDNGEICRYSKSINIHGTEACKEYFERMRADEMFNFAHRGMRK